MGENEISVKALGPFEVHDPAAFVAAAGGFPPYLPTGDVSPVRLPDFISSQSGYEDEDGG